MLKLVFNSFIEKNRYIISALLFLLSYLSLTMLLSIYNNYEYNIKSLQNEEINRTIEVDIDKENALSILKNNKYIETYYPMYNNKRMLYQDKNINFNTSNNVDLIKGSSIKNNNEIIISKSFSKLVKLEETNYNIKLNFKYNEKEYSFTVVGITDNNKADVYLVEEEFQKIFNPEPSSYYVLISDYKDVKKFINQMLDKGYIANLYNATSEEELNTLINLKNTYIGIMIAIILLIFFFLCIIVKNMLQYETKNIAILKAVGYKNRIISLIMLLRLLIVNLFSYLFILFITIITHFISSSIISKYNLSLLKLFYYDSIIMLIISFLIIINISIFQRKIKKLDVINTLQDY